MIVTQKDFFKDNLANLLNDNYQALMLSKIAVLISPVYLFVSNNITLDCFGSNATRTQNHKIINLSSQKVSDELLVENLLQTAPKQTN